MKLTEILKSIFPSLRIPRDWDLTQEEGEFLYELSRSLKKESTILEIGCRNGASTLAIAKGARKSLSEVYSIAAMTAKPVSELKDTFWKLRFPNVNILPPNFSTSQWEEHLPINLFYVNTPNGIADYVLWEKFLAKNAVIAYHDTCWPRDGNKETTEQVIDLIQRVHGKLVQSVDSITSFTLPGCLDKYYESLRRKNPFTQKNPIDSSESLSV